MKLVASIALLAVSTLASIAAAGEIKPYSQQEFDKLTHEGKPVVLDISATWCPTCKQQKPIVDGLMKQPAYKDVTLLTVDFVVRALRWVEVRNVSMTLRHHSS